MAAASRAGGAEVPTGGSPRTFAELRPLYLDAHRDPRCRTLHDAGTSLALAGGAIELASLDPRWLLFAPLVGYDLARAGHLPVGGSPPATFRHLPWSMRGDLVLIGLAVRRGPGAELERRPGLTEATASTERLST